jgi:D-3-phosphoglycerate dehydrogenase / 2-oxoglutarate reductase
MPKIVITDATSEACAARFAEAPGFVVEAGTGLPRDDLKRALRDADGLVVRSATRVDRELLSAAPQLKVVGRAGEGVDNVDVEAATEAGVVVMNTPGGNTVSAAEHTLALILALARDLPDACRSVAEGRWERKRLGVELYGKTLGVVGLGKIGREVAMRARAFGMEIVGHDPFLAADQGARLQIEIVDLPALLGRADFLTVHTPLTAQTRHLIDAAALGRAKPGIRLVNCARGGILDEAAVADAVRSGQVAGAAFDVFESEPPSGSPLLGLRGVIATPHLGASTHEAQEKVAVRIAEQMVDYLVNGIARHALNAETVDPALRPRLEPFRTLAERLGRLGAQLQEAPLQEIRAEYAGDLLELPTGLLTAALLRGYLANVLSEPVNQVNALSLARRVGIAVTEVQSGQHADFASLLSVSFRTAAGGRAIAGTLFGRNRPRLVRLDDYPIELEPEGEILLYSNDDRPGIIGRVGTLLGAAGINIAGMTLGRDRSGGRALGALNTDSRVSDDLTRQIEAIPGILWTRRASL